MSRELFKAALQEQRRARLHALETFVAKAVGHAGNALGEWQSTSVEGAMAQADSAAPKGATVTVRGETTSDGSNWGRGGGRVVAVKESGRWQRYEQRGPSQKAHAFADDTNTPVRCQHCGCKGTDHRGSDGKCPATSGWGSPAPFPSFAGSGTPAGDKKIDAALAKYWSANTTFTRQR